MIHQLKPGKFYQLKIRGLIVPAGFQVCVFTVERGLGTPLYGCYCYTLETWEYLLIDNFL
jgi:hypothetical protein